MRTYLFLAVFFWLTNLQSQEFSTGLLLNDEKDRAIPQKATLLTRSYTNLPPRATLKNYAPIPKSQGSFGTCTGWSTTYAARTIAYAKNMGWTDKDIITENAFSGIFVYKNIELAGNENCQNGTYVQDALEYLKTNGARKFTETEWECPGQFSQSDYLMAKKYRIDDYARLFDGAESYEYKINSLKKSLSEEKVIVFAMITKPSFDYCQGVWQPTDDEENSGFHAMCLVGYDDEKYGGAFEIQNSWGSNWGNNGYMWIRYNDFIEHTRYAYELVDFPDNENNTGQMAGSVRFVENNGQPMHATINDYLYEMKESYPSGTLFRMYIQNTAPAYVYAFGWDLSNTIFPIFPYNKNISAILNYSDNEIALPGESHYVKMDDKAGTDYMLILYSQKPLAFYDLIAQMEQVDGTFSEKMSRVISPLMADRDSIEYNQDGTIGFTFSGNSNKVVPILVSIKHEN